MNFSKNFLRCFCSSAYGAAKHLFLDHLLLKVRLIINLLAIPKGLND